jgi:hypothetical protein
MATGRTLNRWTRVYVGGYDLSCYTRDIGPLAVDFNPVDMTAPMCDAVRGYLPDAPTISPGVLNGLLDNTATTGFHPVAEAWGGTSKVVSVPIGIRAVPAAGDPVFHGKFFITAYQAVENGGAMTVTMPFGGYDVTAMINHKNPWGVLLHANSAVTAVNAAAGVDDNGAASALGGYMVYHVLAGDGTATIKVQDAAVNNDGGFADLSGATSGVIDCSTVQSGIVALGIGATVRQFLRWQIVLGTATTVTFVLSFTRS